MVTCFLGAMTAKASHKWTQVFLTGDPDDFECENIGGKYTPDLYDFFPELEDAAKQYILGRCSEKSASFTVSDWAKFVDEEFYKITSLIKGMLLIIKSLFTKLIEMLFPS